MSSQITLFEKMKLGMDEARDKSISSLMKRQGIMKVLMIWMDNYSSKTANPKITLTINVSIMLIPY
jgi:hypothetical protein